MFRNGLPLRLEERGEMKHDKQRNEVRWDQHKRQLRHRAGRNLAWYANSES